MRASFRFLRLLLPVILALGTQGVSAQRLYWEDPRILVPDGARFPSAASAGGIIAVVWQEQVQNQDRQQEVWLTCSVSQNAEDWRTSRRFAGPFPAQEQEAPVFSLVVSPRGRILVAATSAERQTVVFASLDRGSSFTRLATVEASATTLTPHLSIASNGELLLFVTQEREDSLSISLSRSPDGSSWSELRPLAAADRAVSHLLPWHAAFGGKDYVVYQTRRRGDTPYQLELKVSADGGTNWSAPRSLAFGEAREEVQEAAEEFSNQRPFLVNLEGSLGLVWERALRRNPSRIYYGRLGAEGSWLETPEAVTEGATAAFFPRLLLHRQRPYIFFFSSTEKVFVADRSAGEWTSRELNDLQGSSYFAYPVELAGKLFVFWENRIEAVSKLVMLQPDQKVAPPSLSAENFDPRQPSKLDLPIVRWTAPRDSSGIAGYNYVWSQNPAEPVPGGRASLLPGERTASVKADRDGPWYFRLAAEDFAGNWSEPTTITFLRDTSPPAKPSLLLPPADADGFLLTNSLKIDWQPADPADAAGYAYALEFLGREQAPPEYTSPVLPDTANSTGSRASFANLDNGIYAFAVAALDSAGNRGEPAVALLRLNKYVPVTIVSFVNEQRDPLGTVDLTIGGRGFELDGTVSHVVLDRDAALPYDYSFSRSSGAFRVVSDRLIRGLTVADLEDGVYRIGVVHPVRGVAWVGSTLRIERRGTVKFGDFSPFYRRPWESVRLISRTIGTSTLVVWLAIALLLASFLASIRRLASLAQEGRLLEREVLAVLRGEVPLERKVFKMEELKRKGVGLRLKFTALTMILVLITVMMVAFPLSIFMIDAQRRTLTRGLEQRVDTLLGSLATSAADTLKLPEPDILKLDTLVDQAGTLEETQYLTLTGVGVNNPAGFDYVWVTSDQGVNEKLEGGAWAKENYGRIRLRDGLAPELEQLARQLNRTAGERVSGLIEERGRLLREAAELLTRRDPASQKLADQKQEDAGALEVRINAELQSIRGHTLSTPALDPLKLLPSYVFYLPVVYWRTADSEFYRGAVRLGVSTERISAELRSAQTRLIIQTGIIALVAAGLGLIGAIIMAAITVNPIKKLAAGVAVIRDTEDKEKLKGHQIKVRTRDEIGTLAETVNQMTEGLVTAAIAQKEMTVGKDIQRMFLPLAKDAQGRMGSTAVVQDPRVDIFGYYEGARDVSGDFFDFKQLSDKYFAMIKCDVAGKGVPAALIMVEVATIFATYFRNWTLQSPGLKLEPLASLINDMVEERGFPGRFATLILAILNVETGQVLMCNAGDTTQRVYRQADGSLTEFKLPESPAAGVFSSAMLDKDKKFRQVPQQLASGDVLFLYTDGIEDGLGEASRLMHGAGSESAKKPMESEAENSGTRRIAEVIDAVLNRRPLKLTGHHNPLLVESLEFDFSRCQGSVEEAVLALVSIEKVLRLQPAPEATEKDRILVDQRIDAFLKLHFPQYGTYFTHRVEQPAQGHQVVFTHLKEDPPYDDLTILAVRKK